MVRVAHALACVTQKRANFEMLRLKPKLQGTQNIVCGYIFSCLPPKSSGFVSGVAIVVGFFKPKKACCDFILRVYIMENEQIFVGKMRNSPTFSLFLPTDELLQ